MARGSKSAVGGLLRAHGAKPVLSVTGTGSGTAVSPLTLHRGIAYDGPAIIRGEGFVPRVIKSRCGRGRRQDR